MSKPHFDRRELAWFKSSVSSDNGACVEVALAPDDLVAVRDSKDPDGPVLAFSTEAFAAFVTEAATGRLLPN